MTENQDTAAQAVAGGEWAFRLKSDTSVYELPDNAGAVITMLPAGAIVTVQDRSGDFLRIITPQDSFGFIPASTPVAEIEAMSLAPPPPPPPEPLPASLQAQAAFRAEQEARNARRESDRDWKPEPLHLENAERILIYDRIDENKRSTWMIMGGFVCFLALFFAAIGAVIGFSSYGTFGEQLMITLIVGGVAGAIGLVVAIIMYRSSTSIVLGISGAHQVDKDEEPALYRVVENLSIGSGLPMPRVWVIEDSAPNAFATGRNPGEAHVAATRGLLDKLEKRELEAVMAHEVSHVGNYDTRIMTVVAVVVGLVALLSDMMLRLTRFGAVCAWATATREAARCDHYHRGRLHFHCSLASDCLGHAFGALATARVPRRCIRRSPLEEPGRPGRCPAQDLRGPRAARSRQQGDGAPLHHEPPEGPRELPQQPIRHPSSRRRARPHPPRDVATDPIVPVVFRLALFGFARPVHNESLMVETGVAVRPAAPDDITDMVRLLTAANLPPFPVGDHWDSFWLLEGDEGIVG